MILARLAFGRWLTPGAIPRRIPTVTGVAAPGITAVEAVEVAAARALGYTIRLLAVAIAPRDGADPAPTRTRGSCRQRSPRTAASAGRAAS